MTIGIIIIMMMIIIILCNNILFLPKLHIAVLIISVRV